MKAALLKLLVLWMAFSPVILSAQSGDNTGMAGIVLNPEGPATGDIIDKAIVARGGLSPWKKTRHLFFSERFHSKDQNGKLIQRGQIDKQISRQGDLFYSRSDDQSDSTPAFIRAFGPNGFWMQRSAIFMDDPLMEKAYLFEASRDYLLLFMPYLLKNKNTKKIYQGIKPIHGRKCYQIYVPTLTNLKAFEGYEFLVSIDVNTFCISVIKFWKAKSSQAQTTVFLSAYKTCSVDSTDVDHIMPTHYFAIFPDSSTLTVNYTDMKFDRSQEIQNYLLPKDLNATFPHNKGRELEFSSKEALVRYYPRTTFLVSPEHRHYYLDMRSNTINK
jgi:hypothetical protein